MGTGGTASSGRDTVSIIWMKREWKSKSAGLRINTLVGLGAALFMLVSKFALSIFWIVN